MHLEILAVLLSIIIIMVVSFMRVSYKLVFHESKCISAIKRMRSTTVTPLRIYPQRLSCICVFLVNVMYVYSQRLA